MTTAADVSIASDDDAFRTLTAALQAGGYVTVDSEVGHGTTFTVNLPRDPEPESGGRSDAQTAPLPTGVRETILVVEDEPALLQLSAKALQRLGTRSSPPRMSARR